MNPSGALRALTRSKPAIAAVTTVVAVGLVATACSSSGGGNSGGGSSGAASTQPIKVTAIGIFDSAELSLPDAEAALKAHVQQINDSGGIKGRKIDLSVCNDKFDPNSAADCARQAVSNKSVAVVSPYEPFSPQVNPVLEAAKIPEVFNEVASDSDATSPVSFPADAGVQGIYISLGVEMAKAGCKKVGAVVTSNANTELGSDWLKKGVESQGASYVSTAVGESQADFNAPVAKLLSQGADCIVPTTAPDQGPKVITAAQQSGKKVTFGAVSSEFGTDALQTLGSAVNGMILTDQIYRPTDTEVPAVAEIVAGMKKYAPSVPLSTKFGVGGWADITALQQVLNSIDGAITAQSVFDAVKNYCPKTGLTAEYCYSDPAPDSALPRVKDWNYLVWKVADGKSTLVSPDFQKLPADALGKS